MQILMLAFGVLLALGGISDWMNGGPLWWVAALPGGVLVYFAWRSGPISLTEPVELRQGRSGDVMLCTSCGVKAAPVRPLRGHVLITLIGLICYVVPGLIYMIWRRTGPKRCPHCHSAAIIPVNSPAAASIATPDSHVRCPDCRELVLRDARKCKHCGCGLIPQ